MLIKARLTKMIAAEKKTSLADAIRKCIREYVGNMLPQKVLVCAGAMTGAFTAAAPPLRVAKLTGNEQREEQGLRLCDEAAPNAFSSFARCKSAASSLCQGTGITNR